ncbi:MAG: dihydropyrimidinase [Steroidobacteraceae bacterium]
MSDYDTVIRNGTIVTATDTFAADVGVRDGIVVRLGRQIGPGRHEIDARDRLVMPGGVDSHVHIEQKSSTGVMCADDFLSGTISAAFGGTTTIIPFAAQHRGDSLHDVVREYHALAGPKAVIDYAFHLIVSDPTPAVLEQELPELIRSGYTSFKIYMTYDRLKLDDGQILDVLSVARREGALVMVHAENNEVIKWLAKKLVNSGLKRPFHHSLAHARIAESEATGRMIALATLLDVPILIVHVSSMEAAQTIRFAQDQGLKIYAETCPQYLFLTAQDLDREGLEGAKYCCSPPPRDAVAQEAIWRGLLNGTFQVFSSDHAPYRFDASGKLPKGEETTFKDIANGVPGIELRQALLFSEGVGKGRIDLNEFVALTSTRHAKMYGLHPRKGTIAVGSDADIAIWDPERVIKVTAAGLHDNVGYTPYEGRSLKGWPTTVLSRGRVVVDEGRLQVEPGSGQFLPCGKPTTAIPANRPTQEMERFVADIDALNGAKDCC